MRDRNPGGDRRGLRPGGPRPSPGYDAWFAGAPGEDDEGRRHVERVAELDAQRT